MILRSPKNNFAAQFAFLLGLVFLMVGKPIPSGNEGVYLLRLVKTYQPDFLPNDLSFSATASEHWLFNHLFGLLTLIFSVEILGWLGKISCWAVLLLAFFRLAEHWKIPTWATTLSLAIWLAMGQMIVNDEWIFGSFEAKCAAYICLILALDFFLRERKMRAAILLGLSFSFHPAVGLWAILAVGLSMLYCRWDFKTIVQVVLVTGIFALPGLFNLFHETNSTTDDWKFFVIERVPHHLDPFSWSLKSMSVLAAMFIFCVLADWDKFLKGFIIFLAAFFVLGIVLRFFEQWQLLCLMPMRIFPVFTPLFFFFTLAKVCKEKSFTTRLMAVTLVALALLSVFFNPVKRGFFQVSETYQAWTRTLDDEAKTFIWFKENTAPDTFVLAPPWRDDFWYRSRRAQFVSYKYAPFSEMTEWRKRFDFLFGDEADNDAKKLIYNNLPKDKIAEIRQKHQIKYLVSQGIYDYPIVFQSGSWKVYQLP
jgi:hypothetical protein